MFAIIVIIVVVIVAYFAYVANQKSSKKPVTYDPRIGMVSSRNGLGADISPTTVADLEKLCAENPQCGGFIFSTARQSGQMRTQDVATEALTANSGWDTYVKSQ